MGCRRCGGGRIFLTARGAIWVTMASDVEDEVKCRRESDDGRELRFLLSVEDSPKGPRADVCPYSKFPIAEPRLPLPSSDVFSERFPIDLSRAFWSPIANDGSDFVIVRYSRIGRLGGSLAQFLLLQSEWKYFCRLYDNALSLRVNKKPADARDASAGVIAYRHTSRSAMVQSSSAAISASTFLSGQILPYSTWAI